MMANDAEPIKVTRGTSKKDFRLVQEREEKTTSILAKKEKKERIKLLALDN